MNGLEGHGDHPNDIIPAPATGCPGAQPPPPPPPGSINICHANGSPPTSFTLVTVPQAGHFVHRDAPELVTKTMVRWLTQTDGN